MPTLATISRFLEGTGREHVAFRDAYQIALRRREMMLMEEILAIADDGSADKREVRNQNGDPYLVSNRANILRARQRIQVRQLEVDRLRHRRAQLAERDKDQPRPFIIRQIHWRDVPPERLRPKMSNPEDTKGPAGR